MSGKNSSTLKFDLSEGIESAKLELGYGGHTLVSESLRLEGIEIAKLKLGYGGHALVPELLRPTQWTWVNLAYLLEEEGNTL